MAEAVGFEPTCPCGQLLFECSSLQPLRYVSVDIHLNTVSVYTKTKLPSMKTFPWILFPFRHKLFVKTLLTNTRGGYIVKIPLGGI